MLRIQFNNQNLRPTVLRVPKSKNPDPASRKVLLESPLPRSFPLQTPRLQSATFRKNLIGNLTDKAQDYRRTERVLGRLFDRKIAEEAQTIDHGGLVDQTANSGGGRYRDYPYSMDARRELTTRIATSLLCDGVVNLRELPRRGKTFHMQMAAMLAADCIKAKTVYTSLEADKLMTQINSKLQEHYPSSPKITEMSDLLPFDEWLGKRREQVIVMIDEITTIFGDSGSPSEQAELKKLSDCIREKSFKNIRFAFVQHYRSQHNKEYEALLEGMPCYWIEPMDSESAFLYLRRLVDQSPGYLADDDTLRNIVEFSDGQPLRMVSLINYLMMAKTYNAIALIPTTPPRRSFFDRIKIGLGIVAPSVTEMTLQSHQGSINLHVTREKLLKRAIEYQKAWGPNIQKVPPDILPALQQLAAGIQPSAEVVCSRRWRELVNVSYVYRDDSGQWAVRGFMLKEELLADG